MANEASIGKAPAECPPAVRLQGIAKVYQMGDVQVHALRGIDLEIAEGEWAAIMGASGSGKSTLMNIIGCLDQATGGTYWLSGTDVSVLNDNQLSDIRGRRIGFVFQQFNLLARQTALQNVELPMLYTGNGHDRRERAVAALESVGLAGRMHHKPMEMSGGQQQRVAIARALVNDPAFILADEPTGNLDSQTGKEIVALFRRLHEERGITLIFVTHDPGLGQQAPRRITLRDGQVTDDQRDPA
ncbi:MAG: ABC transporter ATP-binding protein [Chloroflexi bacterium]|nr:ABC transporter ATP-binding protein [Chloroflexota bacterium]